MNAYVKSIRSYGSRLLLSLLIALFSLTDSIGQFEENWGLSWLFHLRGSVVPPSDLVIVSIDNQSIEALNLKGPREKWPRALYAELIGKINRLDPAIIGFNILFSENRDPDGDLSMAKAMRERRNVILPNYVKQVNPSFESVSTFSNYQRIIDPIPVLADEALAIAPFPLPKTASTIKRFWLDSGDRSDLPTFPIAVFKSYLLNKAYPEMLSLLQQLDPLSASNLPGDLEHLLFEKQALKILLKIEHLLTTNPLVLHQFEKRLAKSDFDVSKVRLLKSWTALITRKDHPYFNYYGKKNAIMTIPLYRVLSDDPISHSLFAGKIVLIGFSENIEPEKRQGFYTVFSGSDGDTFSSVEIAATAIANLIEQSWLIPLSTGHHFLLIALWVLFLSTINRLLNFRLTLIAVVLLAICHTAVAYFLFSAYSIWMPLVIPVLVLTPSFLTLISLQHFLKSQREKQNLVQAFSLYLPSDIVKSIAVEKNVAELSQYGKVVEGICMATDAGQYTCLAEKLPPHQLIDLMNSYYATIFPEIKNHNGTISDIIGDAMLALWTYNAFPLKTQKEACRAALNIKEAVARFNRLQPHQLPIRIGLHSGEMHLGNVGTTVHYEYRAVGDMVNTACRIESLNKILDTQILASSEIIKDLPGFFYRELGHFVLLGKSVQVGIHEIISGQNQVDAYWSSLAAAFEKALYLFKSFRWSEALEAFLEIAEQYPNDGPTRFYINYLKTNLPFWPEKMNSEQGNIIQIGNFTNRSH